MARFTVNNVLFASLVILCVFAGKGLGRPAEREEEGDYINDDYADGDDLYDTDSGENKDNDEATPSTGEPPVITTAPLNLTVKPGTTVWLPCDTENADNYATLWRKDKEFLWTDIVRQIKDTRFKRFHNNTISIVNVRDSDSGHYTCEISSEPSVLIIHELHVPTAPQIIDVMPKADHGKIKKVKKGDSLTLECKVSGYPVPEVRWVRKNKKMPSGEEAVIGTSITFSSVTRHHNGLYECTASNGLGNPVSRMIEIHVQYAPEISIEKETVNTAEGFESELICTVHAEPKAVIEWQHNGKPVSETSSNVVTNENGAKHTLKLMNTKKEDFGSYMCKATNPLGSNHKTAKLSGLPNQPMYIKHEDASDGMSEVMEWTVESSSPITEYKLEYRKTDDKTAWVLVESPIVENPEGNKYTVKHTFFLPPGKYESVLRAKNTYGWSEPSSPQRFVIDYETHDEAPKMTGANTGTAEPSSSAAEDIRPRLFAVMAILSLTTYFL